MLQTLMCLGAVAVVVALGIGIMLWVVLSQKKEGHESHRLDNRLL
jgi:uncharacterized protein HemX